MCPTLVRDDWEPTPSGLDLSANKEDNSKVIDQALEKNRHGQASRTPERCSYDGCTHLVFRGGVCWRHGGNKSVKKPTKDGLLIEPSEIVSHSSLKRTRENCTDTRGTKKPKQLFFLANPKEEGMHENEKCIAGRNADTLEDEPIGFTSRYPMYPTFPTHSSYSTGYRYLIYPIYPTYPAYSTHPNYPNYLKYSNHPSDLTNPTYPTHKCTYLKSHHFSTCPPTNITVQFHCHCIHELKKG